MLLVTYLGSRMVPGIALIVPLYLTIKTLHLLDNLAALAITYLTLKQNSQIKCRIDALPGNSHRFVRRDTISISLQSRLRSRAVASIVAGQFF